MKRLFISRPLKASSPLLRSFPRHRYEWTDLSLMEFRPVDFTLKPADWLFFYSQKGVEFFFRNALVSLNRINDYRTACYGSSTARIFEAYGGPPDYTGTGESHSTFESFAPLAMDQTVCFVQAENSRSALQGLVRGEFTCLDLVVYKNTNKTGLTLGEYDAAIFTSPLNYRSFCENGGKAHRFLSIGKTTAAEIQRASGGPVYVADVPSEAGLAEKLTEIIYSV